MEQTIGAISSATSPAGIGIVRLSGDRAIEIGKKIFKPDSAMEIIDRHMHYGRIYDGLELIDEVMAVFMEGPRTYTREDMVEIYTHGSVISLKKVLDLVLKEGAIPAEKGEFTKRAFLNGRMDLSQAEAVIDLINSKTEKSHSQSLLQLEGGLTVEIRCLREKTLALLVDLEAAINFSEDDESEYDTDFVESGILEVNKSIEKLLSTVNRGKLLRDGINTIILGKPNVGKSSLLNNLLRENRAIVTDIPGTTRDVIQESLDIGGIAVNLIDTAGIRETEDLVEQLGVDRSIDLAQAADLIIAIFDNSKEFEEEDQRILDLIMGKKSIILLNKSDLEERLDVEKIYAKIGESVVIESSMASRQGIEELEKAIYDLFYGGELDSGNQVVISNARQEDLLRRALEDGKSVENAFALGISIDCIEVDLRNLWLKLGEILGESGDMEEILDSIFTEFCLGK